MTAHLLILYPVPKDTAKFDRAYREEHLPYAGPRLVGATGVTTKRVVGPAFAPPPYHLMSDVSFPTVDALKACAASESGKEALAHAASISSGGAHAHGRDRSRLNGALFVDDGVGVQGATRRLRRSCDGPLSGSNSTTIQ